MAETSSPSFSPNLSDAHAPAAGRARFWRDDALEGAWLMDAHYAAHRFERHLHDELVIVVTEQGSGEVETRFGTERSGPGTVWVFAAGEYHCGRVHGDAGWRYRAIYLDEPSLDALSDVLRDGMHRKLSIAPGLYDDAGLAARQALWWSAMGLLFSRYGLPRMAPGRVGNDKHRLRTAHAFVHANFMRDFSIDELSQAAGLSRFHLMRAFRKEFGLPPHTYANQLKLIAAKQKLQAGVAPAEVAVEVGFYDQSHLTRLFKRAFDLTPGRFAALHSRQ
ncbi:AraC family transcriptional regulator [Ramlibacter sp.]|uniref:helix-turn-helix transcriptional regulator n=1 Tax=Ramlibacter sp. TaxID=1917967 RepID=UPI0017BF3097|nr:AraC family transcriptional regulator [Ramlibacter sp.]MBA2673334.1 AraC family transcriptional regulator [Ramlibacter sp.]